MEKQTNLFLFGKIKPNQFLTQKTTLLFFLILKCQSLIFGLSTKNIKNYPLPAGMLLPKKTASVDFSLEIEFACLLGEGLLDFLLLHPETTDTQLSRISYLLQATKTKISRTEYIACPSCGRTLFNLQEVTERVKAKTNHLKGVKIGIMGCMVNGPGEMADSDFGYVGSATGKVDLYLGHKKIQRSVPESQAVEKLIELIKEEGRWVDAPA